MPRDDLAVSLTLDELERLIEQSVNRALRNETAPLADDVRELKRRLPVKKVLTHKQVAKYYLDGEVTPRTIKRYIKEEGLPATKQGNLYYIEVEKLEAWLTDRSE